MQLSLPIEELVAFTTALIESNFPDGASTTGLDPIVRRAVERVEYCFARVCLPGYARGGKPCFDHLHGDQTAVFFYYVSNEAFRAGDAGLAAKLMLLNKTRNGIVITYDTVLPDVMLLIHTTGCMLGKAQYANYFVATQNVTVGSDRGAFPTFGEGVVLYPGSFVGGNSVLGDDVRVAVNSVVLHETIPAAHIAAGRSPSLIVKPTHRSVRSSYFRSQP